MDNKKYIGSLQNPLVKKVLLLKEKSRERRKTGHFVLEGTREIQLALRGGYEMETVLFFADIISDGEVIGLLQEYGQNPEIIEISKDVYRKAAYRDTTEGVLAISRSKDHNLENLKLNTKNPLILVAEAPEKPGNIGA